MNHLTHHMIIKVNFMHKMKQKKQFVRPAVLQELSLLPDMPILAGSVVDNVTVVSAGQPVEDINADDQDWNKKWEWE